MLDIYTPHEAEVLEFIEESPDIFTLRLCLTDVESKSKYSFAPGQFNMLYFYGVGEVAISIVNDREHRPGYFEHTIQVVGRITNGMVNLKKGDTIGVRGPFGTKWPLEKAKGKDVVIATGGLGNAPLVAAVEHILKNRHDYGKLKVLHGIRTSDLLIYEDMYQRWHNSPNTEVLMATNNEDPRDNGKWKWARGFVTEFIPQLDINFKNSLVMSVGPEIMMKNVAKAFFNAGIAKDDIYLSLERSMKCAVGHCGHCQLGAEFVCKDGPVYTYTACEKLLEIKGL